MLFINVNDNTVNLCSAVSVCEAMNEWTNEGRKKGRERRKKERGYMIRLSLFQWLTMKRKGKDIRKEGAKWILLSSGEFVHSPRIRKWIHWRTMGRNCTMRLLLLEFDRLQFHRKLYLRTVQTPYLSFALGPAHYDMCYSSATQLTLFLCNIQQYYTVVC